MSVIVKTDRRAWKSATGKGCDFGAAALSEQMMDDSLDKIPKQEGTLRDIGRIVKPEDGERDLVWSNAYALPQWFGMWMDGTHVVEHYTTPGTGKAWVDTARAENQSKWDKVAQNGFTEGMKK